MRKKLKKMATLFTVFAVGSTAFFGAGSGDMAFALSAEEETAAVEEAEDETAAVEEAEDETAVVEEAEDETAVAEETEDDAGEEVSVSEENIETEEGAAVEETDETKEDENDSDEPREEEQSEEEEPREEEEESQEEELSEASEETVTDAYIETYLKENANPEYTEVSEVKLVNAMSVMLSFFDGALIEEGDNLFDLFSAEDQDPVIDKFVMTTYSTVAMYELSEESDYYAALVNTLQGDPGYYVKGWSFALNDTGGNNVEGCIYETNTGIAYIPKKLLAYTGDEETEEGKTAVWYNYIQVQLMEIMSNTNTPESETVLVEQEGEEDAEIFVSSSDIYDFSTTVKTETGLDDDDYAVYLNGIPLDDDQYDYNSKTGEVTVAASSCAASSISVSIEEESFIETAWEMLDSALSTTVYGDQVGSGSASEISSINELYDYDDVDWDPEGKYGVGTVTHGKATSYNRYDSTGFRLTSYSSDNVRAATIAYWESFGFIYGYTAWNPTIWEQAATYAHASDVGRDATGILVGNGDLTGLAYYSYSQYISESNYVSTNFVPNVAVKMSTFVTGDGATDYPLTVFGTSDLSDTSGSFLLTCSHVDLSTWANQGWSLTNGYNDGGTVTVKNGEEFSYLTDCSVGIRVLASDTDSEGQYIIFGIYQGGIYYPMQSYRSQSSAGVFKVYINRTGFITLNKSSYDTALTDGNDCYSLSGATYEIYTDAECTSSSGSVLTTNAEGLTDTIELPSGTYYIKETYVPENCGYDIDETVYKAEVSSKSTVYSVVSDGKTYNQNSIAAQKKMYADGTTINVFDVPLGGQITFDLYKLDADSGAKEPEGGATFSGTQFTLSYWDNTNGDISEEPLKTWIFEPVLDAESGTYTIDFENEECLVLGDDLFKDVSGTSVIYPIGTYKIYESLEPEGYLLQGSYVFTDDGKETQTGGLNDEIIFLITEEDGYSITCTAEGDSLLVYDEVIRGGVEILKYDSEYACSLSQDGGTLEGIEFNIFNAGENGIYVPENAGIKLADSSTTVTCGDALYYYYATGEKIGTVSVEWDEEYVYTQDDTEYTGAYVAKTTADALPYGTYVVMENISKEDGGEYYGNDYYLWSDDAYVFEIQNDGEIVTDGYLWRNYTDTEMSEGYESDSQMPYVLIYTDASGAGKYKEGEILDIIYKETDAELGAYFAATNSDGVLYMALEPNYRINTLLQQVMCYKYYYDSEDLSRSTSVYASDLEMKPMPLFDENFSVGDARYAESFAVSNEGKESRIIFSNIFVEPDKPVAEPQTPKTTGKSETVIEDEPVPIKSAGVKVVKTVSQDKVSAGIVKTGDDMLLWPYAAACAASVAIALMLFVRHRRKTHYLD